jgi:hypothetical protein
MKNQWYKPALSGLTAALLFTGCSPAPKPTHPTVSQLDLDGDFLLFANTSTIEQTVKDSVDQLLATIVEAGELDAADTAEATALAEKIKTGIDWSGLLALDSFGLSSKNLDTGLSRSISVLGFSEDDGKKALWRILASEPSALKGIGFVPSDAVFSLNYTASLKALWTTFNEAKGSFMPAENQQALSQQIAMIEMVLGVSMDDLFSSLDNEIMLSIQLSETRTCTLPVEGEMLTIPEPSLLIGLKSIDPMVSELILTKLQAASAPLATSEHGAYTLNTINLPIPMPFPVQPTLVQTEDYLLIGSSLETITKALDSQANQDGLAATPLYGKLLADAPEKTSSIEFISPRFMETYMAIFKQVFSSKSAEFAFLYDTMYSDIGEISAGTYSLKTPEGIYSQTLANEGQLKPVELLSKMYFTAITSALTIPFM